MNLETLGIMLWDLRRVSTGAGKTNVQVKDMCNPSLRSFQLFFSWLLFRLCRLSPGFTALDVLLLFLALPGTVFDAPPLQPTDRQERRDRSRRRDPVRMCQAINIGLQHNVQFVLLVHLRQQMSDLGSAATQEHLRIQHRCVLLDAALQSVLEERLRDRDEQRSSESLEEADAGCCHRDVCQGEDRLNGHDAALEADADS